MTLPVKKIVAMGGGEVRELETLAIDREIIRLSEKEHPRLLFIPTASSDNEDYWGVIRNNFGSELGCETDVLWLIREKPSMGEIERKILTADLIYVGGGNTLKMMNLWRRLGVDQMLKTAWERGIVLCGMSAGSICWFDSGHSDSRSFRNSENWKYIRVSGLGFIQGIHCPHYDGHTLDLPRREHFSQMMQKTTQMGIAIDNNCAIIFMDDQYKVINSKDKASAWRVFKQNGKVVTRQIAQNDQFSPVTELYER
ncbi:MAG: peptidase E [Bacteroidia bacterium]|nr:peptidase E [Bacteroidia bacterium]